jgi:8-oxo-dGTP diphosphatase
MTDAAAPPMARPRVAAGALFFDAEDRVLLVKPTYKEGWEIPGGYVEPGETPLEACRREVNEELGLEVAIGDLLVVDWAPSEHEGDKVLFVFDGGMLSSRDAHSIVLPADEIAEFGFVAAQALPTLLIARLARRVERAMDARRSNVPSYLEAGAYPTDAV